MIKVITYGTFDVLHYGHIRLLERAKQLGDYLIVGITAEDFDIARGKINVHQSLMERIEAVRALGIADEIVIEEYEGQKIDDIKKYNIDIFTVGSDWEGYFDYLNEYCKVVYLERTSGVSSTDIRSQRKTLRLGLIGDALFLNKVIDESQFVNGLQICSIFSNRQEVMQKVECNVKSVEEVIECSDAVYIRSQPKDHYSHILKAIEAGKHVLCESPLSLSEKETKEVISLAEKKGIVLMEAIKTAYATAFSRLLLLIKSGIIGKVVSVEATCTSLKRDTSDWSGCFEWGPTALLPVFSILGTDVAKYHITSRSEGGRDSFSKIDFWYSDSVASVFFGDGIKSEGELIISGTKGYVYVPAPWWKTDYFEIRYEDQSRNKRYFFQLDGEGIRYELVAFVRAIESGRELSCISQEISIAITKTMEDLTSGRNTTQI